MYHIVNILCSLWLFDLIFFINPKASIKLIYPLQKTRADKRSSSLLHCVCTFRCDYETDIL